MRRYSGYKKGTPTKEWEKLPPGGYVLEILDAEEVHYSWGDALKLSFDIAEGERKDFYKQNYLAQQETKKWKGTRSLTIPADDADDGKKDYFANQMACIEASNPGFVFDFDENALKGKLVGAVFGEKEYAFNGKHGFFVTCRGFRTADAIREGKFQVPQPLMLEKKEGGASDGFYPVNNEDDSDLPF